MKKWLFLLLTIVSIQSYAIVFPAGSVIIDMGNATPTNANTMRGYGLIYSLLKWKSVPINCIINTGKAKDGIDFTATTTVYPSFATPTSRSFYAGCYVISAEFVTASVRTTLDSAQSTKWGSVAKYYISTAIDLPVSYTLKFAPRWVLNNTNVGISEDFFDAAGIPRGSSGTGNYAISYKLPPALGACDDIFVMPHADPTWTTHQNLLAWNETHNGAIWAGCHAVSVFENLSNGTGGVGGTTYMNFLTTTPSPLATISSTSNNRGLRHYDVDPLGNHGDGSAPYSTAFPADPVYQYRGTVDGAQEGGSEQIYFPKRNSNWNPGAKLGVWDPTPPTALDGIFTGSGSNRSGGFGAKVIYGRGFDNPNRGYVMYEGGHDINGTAVPNVNAVRIFFNFSFLAGTDKTALVASYALFTTPPPTSLLLGGTTGTMSINSGNPLPAGYTVQWSSSVAGGSFSNPTGVTTTYTAPNSASCAVQNIITATVTQTECGRSAFDSKGVNLVANATPTISTSSQLTFCPGSSAAFLSSYAGAGNQWYKDGVAIAAPAGTAANYSATTSGEYTVIYTNPSTSCPSLESAGITVLVSCFNVSGNVWIDANGDAIKAGGEANYLAGGLNAILVDGSGNVAETVPVNGSGVYTLTKLPQSLTGYKIIISTNAGTVGSPAPAIVLPAGANGYLITGENFNGTPETGVNANATILLPATVAAIPNLNFGIQQRPLGNAYTAASQPNPGGTNTVVVPSAAFTGSDPEDGSYTSGLSGRTVRLSPATNGTLYYNGVAVNSATDFASFNPALVTLDPTGNGVVTPTFNYQVYDNANVPSLVKTITMPFTDLTVGGRVFNDANGTLNSLIDGTGIGSPASTTPITQLYVNVVNGSNNVVGSVAVNADGTYTLGNAAGITINTNYSLVLSTTQGTIGQPVASVLPTGWVHTAQGSGAGDGTPTDGLKTVSVVGSIITSGLDFGINRIPVGANYTAASQVNPGGTNTIVIPSAAFTGTDGEDGTYSTGLSGRKVRLSPATNGTLYYNGVAVNAATDFTSFNPALVTLDPNDGNISPAFDYQVYDNANFASLVKTITMPFTDLTIGGRVFNDANGTLNSLIDGTGIGSPASTTPITQLYVNVVNGSNNVVGSVAVNADGTYTLGNAAGITINTNYSLVLSTTQGTIGQPVASVLPTGWVHTAQGSGAGDGTPTDGLKTVSVVGSVITSGLDFGINRIPVGADYTAASQSNPGGTATIVIPSAAFTGTDGEDGTYSTGLSGRKVRLSPATNGTLYYNGVAVNAATDFTSFNPALVTLDPNDGNISPAFDYQVYDNANFASLVKTITMPFTDLTIGGRVFNDANGTLNSLIDGTGIGSPASTTPITQLYVNVVNGSNNVVGSVAVNADGTYTLGNAAGITINTNYSLVLSTTQGTIGQPVASVLPTGWVHTAQGSGAGDGTPTDGLKTVSVVGSVITSGLDFGINRIPVGADYTATSQANPGGTATVVIPSAAFTGTDGEDGTYSTGLSGRKVRLSPATNGTLYYNGVAVNAATDFTGFNPALVTLDPNDGNISPAFDYQVYDNANFASLVKTITMPFTDLTIGGRVFNDANGTLNSLIDGTGIGSPASTTPITQLYVNVVNGSNNVVGSVAVNADGTYTLGNAAGITINTNYSLVLSTTQGTIGQPVASVLPTGWVHTAQGSGAGDGTPTDGLKTVSVVGSVITSGLDFGINRIPVGANYTAASQVNPGGTNTIVIPSAAFTGTDGEDGTYSTGLSGRKVRLSPATNGTLYYNGVAVNAATDFTSFNPALVTLDPNDGNISPAFDYQVYDNANFASLVKTITMPFTDLTIGGRVFNDANGTLNSLIDGTGIGSPASTTPITQLYVNVVNGSNNVVGSVAVNADGTYTLGNAAGITINTNYSLVLSTTQGTIGQPVASVLPTGWVHTAQGSGAGDGTPTDGLKTVSVVGSVITSGLDFGINRIPVGADYTATSQANPGGTATVVIPSAAFTGTDGEDGTYTVGLGGRTVRLSPATNGTLYYNGVAVNAATDFSSFNPALVTLDPNDGTVTPTFDYQVYDNAGVVSLVKTISMPFTQFSITMQLKVLLQGAVLGNTAPNVSIMRDNLRNSPFTAANYIPGSDPYTNIPAYSSLFARVGDGTSPSLQTILNPGTMFADRTGTNTSAVDWIFIELRSKADSTIVLGTRSAIVQQDGTVVDIDGSSCISFPSLFIDNYFVSVRHRNHSGAMTATALPVGSFNCSSTIDFTTMTNAQLWHNPATPAYDGLEMATLSDGKRALWAGNTNVDGKVKYQGGGNDRTDIQLDVLGFSGNTTFNINYDFAYGYFKGDVNMDSKVKFQGGGNDRTLVQSIVLGYLLNTTLNVNYDFFLQQLP